MAAELESRLGGRIGQLSYEQRGHAADSNGVATMPRLLDDLDLALAQATGEVVLVVQSLAAIVLQEWLYRHRRDPRLNIAAIIAVSPVTELPDPAGGFDRIPRTLGRHYGDRMIGELSGELGTRALWLGPHRIEAARRLLRTYRRRTAELAVVEDLLRATPTWLLAGEQDPIVSPAAVGELAERVWAEHETIPAARHDLAGSHPAAVTDAIVDALRVAHEAGRYGERRC
ncbi:alpha/beta fold hydrolase [Nocardia asteroides]